MHCGIKVSGSGDCRIHGEMDVLNGEMAKLKANWGSELGYLEIFRYFDDIPDPRVERTRLHPLINILTIAMLTMICVGEGWDDMEAFGDAKEEWLGTFLDLRNGIVRRT